MLPELPRRAVLHTVYRDMIVSSPAEMRTEGSPSAVLEVVVLDCKFAARGHIVDKQREQWLIYELRDFIPDVHDLHVLHERNASLSGVVP